MLGLLPKALNVCGVSYAIRSDYRNILRIIVAYNDGALSDNEKVFVCLKRMYVDFDNMPRDHYEQAYLAATAFIECHAREDTPAPKTVNWEKDEQLIFPAVNKVAGVEVRALPYLHWWTFLGYYQSIDHDGLFGFVLTIRQKKAKGKKLEKHEQEFFRSNTTLCLVEDKPAPQKVEDTMKSMFDSLPEEGDT